MGDFYLDFREAAARRSSVAKAASLLKFSDGTRTYVLDSDGEVGACTVLVTRPEAPGLWDPFTTGAPGKRTMVVLGGRVALSDSEWKAAEELEGNGGLACKAIYQKYKASGISGLTALSGNFVIFIHDAAAGLAHLITDPWGMFLLYHRPPLNEARTFGSHPDVVASVTGEDQNLDLTSLAEFIITGRLTFPHTYYTNVRGLEPASLYTFTFTPGGVISHSIARYFQFGRNGSDFKIQQDELTRDFAAAFRSSVRRRTLGRFGRTAVALSGGLDSRVILSCAEDRERLCAFHLYDEENSEFHAARRLAAAARVEFLPVRRPFEYYADSAERAVRISGGTGNISSNHFLGMEKHFAQWGIQNLLTGCYCDYLFKGLALNTTEAPVTRSERIAPFALEFYRPCYWTTTQLGNKVRERMLEAFGESRVPRLSAEEWMSVERKRSLPLAYEADSAQRVVPQRVFPWFVPVADWELLKLYAHIPSAMKLNSALFRNMAILVCDAQLQRVPDNNTGAPLTASGPRRAVHRYATALRNRVKTRLRPGIATHGSWPNWEYYLAHSQRLPALWARKNPVAQDYFQKILGQDPFPKPLADYRGRNTELFCRLLTQKLWLDQRTGVSATS
jgi:asparagine synthase (glutamine-hydrolysing)